MKKNHYIFTLGVVAVSMTSCSQTLPTQQDVEAVERAAPITPVPDFGQNQAGRNAVDYANDRRYRYGRFGSGGGFR